MSILKPTVESVRRELERRIGCRLHEVGALMEHCTGKFYLVGSVTRSGGLLVEQDARILRLVAAGDLLKGTDGATGHWTYEVL